MSFTFSSLSSGSLMVPATGREHIIIISVVVGMP